MSTLLREILVSIESVFVRQVVVAITLTIKLALVASAVAVFLSSTKPLVRLAKSFVLLMAPLFLVNLTSIGMFRMKVASVRVMAAKQQEASIPSPGDSRRPRLVVLVFDEFDQHFTFEARPRSVALPQLDEIRQQSVFASSVYPAGEDTLVALPAMTTGRHVQAAKVEGPAQLKLTLVGNRFEEWGSQATIFSSLAKEKFQTGLAGWHHPYCRIFANTVAECHQQGGFSASSRADYLSELGLTASSLPVFTKLANLFTLDSYLGIAPFLRVSQREVELARQDQLNSYLAILGSALSMATNPDLHLVFIHWPIPHPMGIYDRHKKELTLNPKANYLDNLELVDRTLDQLRQAMQTVDLWDKTMLLITGDHQFRHKNWRRHPWQDDIAWLDDATDRRRIPFLLKFPDQKTGTQYDASFNIVLLHDLILALMREDVSTPEQFRHWMDLNRSRFPLDLRDNNSGT
ncbi:MAG: sulfatase-like hydrolase/transferase [Acidobacteria bacterium]|nr:sulfatase-like hydrolase/transferase [Acidobacteriota bacterium]